MVAWPLASVIWSLPVATPPGGGSSWNVTAARGCCEGIGTRSGAQRPGDREQSVGVRGAVLRRGRPSLALGNGGADGDSGNAAVGVAHLEDHVHGQRASDRSELVISARDRNAGGAASPRGIAPAGGQGEADPQCVADERRRADGHEWGPASMDFPGLAMAAWTHKV